MEQKDHMEYDNKKFAALVNIAMAYRKPSEFAKNLQIPSRYLAVLLNGKCTVPPKPELIEKIANGSLGRVTAVELAAAAGYGAPAMFPQKERLPQIGKREAIQVRPMNQEVLQGYLKRMMGTIGNDNLMDAMDYRGSRYRIHLKKCLNPDHIEIPEKFLKKKEGDMPEEIPENRQTMQESQGTKAEVAPFDLAELAILRYVRKQVASFSIEGSSPDQLVIRQEDGIRICFNLRLALESPSESDVLAVYKECAALLPEAYGKYRLVFINEDVLRSFKASPMANLRIRPSAILVSGAQVIREEGL